jgi:hypothetical protein
MDRTISGLDIDTEALNVMSTKVHESYCKGRVGGKEHQGFAKSYY